MAELGLTKAVDSNGKIGAIQDLRGVAVMLVLLVHAINVVDLRVAHGVDAQRGFLSGFLSVNEFGACGVDLFFVISGFVMSLLLDRSAGEPRLVFMRKRLIRIAPLFWLAGLLFTILTWAVGRHIPIGLLVANVTILPPSPFHYDWPALVVGWSLGFELVFYALVTIALGRAEARKFLALLVATLALFAIVHAPRPGLLAVIANPIQLEFLCGIGVYALWSAVRESGKHAVLATIALAVGAGALLAQAAYGFPFVTDHLPIIAAKTSLARVVYWGLPWALVVLGYALLEPRLAARLSMWRRSVRLTGEASDALYLVHMSPLLLAETLMPANAVQPDLLILFLLAISWTTGVAAHIWVERPLLAALSRASFRRWSRSAPVISPTS